MPLTLRLIGLQVSHLKDLRLPDDQGIKKFFSNANSKEPALKKRRTGERSFIEISSDDEVEAGGMEDEPTSDDDVVANEVPQAGPSSTKDGRVEISDDEDDGISSAQKPNFFGSSDDEDSEPPIPPRAGPSRTKPHSHSGTPPSAASSSSLKPPPTTKPVSASGPSAASSSKPASSKAKPPPSASSKNKLESKGSVPCPICGRPQPAGDNAALNAHVDFCLSRGVILEASREGDRASSSSKAEDNKAKGKKRVNPFGGKGNR